MMRPWVVAVLGSVTDVVPELARLLASVVGNVNPPSVESSTFTSALLIGTAVVPATFQVTVVAAPPARLTAVLGAVTAKPALATVVRVTVLVWLMPPTIRPSAALKC